MTAPTAPEHKIGKRPLVSFVIITYNQEQFIEEAVASALSQTYEPMQVILSDDCSTDATFEVMQRIISSYKGAHSVLLRKTPHNMGTFLHVADLAPFAEGELLILAAGDDVSKKNRAEELVKAWQATGAWGLYSRFDRVAEDGRTISESEDPRQLFSPEYRLRHYVSGDPSTVGIIHGATSAYDRRLFMFLDVKSSDYILSEDGVLSVLLTMLGKKIHMVDKSLVSYRQNSQSLTNSSRDRRKSLEVIRDDEERMERFSRSHANRCELFLRWDESLPGVIRKLNTQEIEADLRKLKVRAAWRETGLRQRLAFVGRNIDRREWKWALPRLLPMPIFFRIKFLLGRLI